MAKRLPPPPTFLIIGAQKSATRWLRFNLGKHPEIFAASHELEFFNYRKRYLTRGTEGYRELFEGWNGETHVGESTPGYMIPRHKPFAVAKRIRETVPDVRLIAIVRNPVDRAQSAMIHHIKRGRLPPDTRLVDFVRTAPPDEEWLGLIAGGRYAASLKPYVRLFGDQLQVLVHDDIQVDSKTVYSRALRHIGADPDFVPDELDEVVFSNRSSASERSDLSIEDRRELYEYFRADIRKLEKIIDRDLSVWRPEGSPARAQRTLGESWEWRFVRTADWVAGRLRHLAPDDYGRPTSHEGRSVGDEVDLLITNTCRYSALLRDAEHSWDDPFDVEWKDPVAAYRAAAQELRAAVDESEERESSDPSEANAGRTRALAILAIVSQLAHGWEVAAATSQDSKIPEDLVESADGFVRRLVATAPGGTGDGLGLGQAVDVDESATPTERFVALLGRDPSFYARRGDLS